MRWLVSLILIGGSAFFLYTRFNQKEIQEPQREVPAPMALAKQDPQPFLTVEELKKVRKSVRDGDPGVRWSALELLFTFRDPQSVKLLEKAIAEDPDPDLRLKAIRLLSANPNAERVPALVRGLTDVEKDVRLASLEALGNLGDASASPWVVEALKDPEADVKRAALNTLGKFQEKRKREFQELSDKLRVQYETAVKKAQKAKEYEE